MAGLAFDAHRRATGYADPLASPGLAALLAVEIPARPAADSGRPAATDHHDGPREPNLGRRAIADELLLKLGLIVSPRTVGRYLRRLRPSRGGRPAQRWATFVRNHAHAVLACDFFTTITVRFRILYVFVVLDVGTRRIIHWNVTEHPTADWTIQQCRAAITGETAHRFLIHDRDAIYAPAVDRAIRSMGLRVLEDARANAAGQCVLRAADRDDPAGMSGLADPVPRTSPARDPARVGHALQPGRPHASLGPGIPEPSPADPARAHRPSPIHRLDFTMQLAEQLGPHVKDSRGAGFLIHPRGRCEKCVLNRPVFDVLRGRISGDPSIIARDHPREPARPG